jgi:hypothetical protein
MSVTLLEKIQGSEGTRRGQVFRNNLNLKTLTPSTISENSATLRGVVSNFFAPAFFDDSVDVYFAYYPTGEEFLATEQFVGTFSENVTKEVVSLEISGLTRNTAYEFYLFGEIDSTRVTSKERIFRTGAFSIETVEVNGIQEEQATFVGELAEFRSLVFENSGPFDVISDENSGLITFANQQESESPLFVLDGFSNNDVRTTVNTDDQILDIVTTTDSSISLTETLNFDIQNSKGFASFSQNSFDIETQISREITSGFEYKKTNENGLKDVIATPPPTDAGDLFEATVTLDPNSEYEFRAFGTIGSFERVRGDFQTFSTLEKEIVGLKTQDVQNIGVTEATLNGEVLNIEPEGRNVDVGFQYGVAAADENTSGLQETGSLIEYNQTVTGLDAGTTYVYRAYAEGDTGSFSGETDTFQTKALVIETLPQPPESEEPSKQPTEGSAYLFGRINDLNPESSSAAVSFQFGKEEPLTQTVNAGVETVDPNGFDVNVTGLDAGEEYKYKLIASDPTTGITEEGEIKTFETVDLEVATEEADPGRTEATLNGFITTLESSGSHNVSFEYRQKGSGNPFTQTTPQELTTQTGFDATITGLLEGTVYEYRAVIEKNTAKEVGETLEFQTDAVEISTLSASAVGAGSAILNGELTFVGSEISDIDIYFYYREQGESARIEVPASETPTSSTGDFTAFISGLDPNKTYEFQAAADPSIKREQTGSFNTFTTKKLSVETANIPIRRTTTSLLVEGNLTEYGGSFSNSDDKVLAHQSIGDISGGEATVGIQYVRAGSQDIDNGEFIVSPDSPLTSLQTFQTRIEELLEGTKYDVRAFVEIGGARTFGKVQRVSTKLND